MVAEVSWTNVPGAAPNVTLANAVTTPPMAVLVAEIVTRLAAATVNHDVPVNLTIKQNIADIFDGTSLVPSSAA